MTIFNTANLPEGQFRDAYFFYQDSSGTGGRKTITHEYPNKKERYVEDNGGLEKKFSLNVFTDDNVSYADRDNLIQALDESGIGTLIHPEFDELQVVCVGYSFNSSIEELGITKFSIEFEIASLNILPTAINGNKGFLAILPVLFPKKLIFSFTVVENEKDEQKFSNELLTAISINPSYFTPFTSRYISDIC